MVSLIISYKRRKIRKHASLNAVTKTKMWIWVEIIHRIIQLYLYDKILSWNDWAANCYFECKNYYYGFNPNFFFETYLSMCVTYAVDNCVHSRRRKKKKKKKKPTC